MCQTLESDPLEQQYSFKSYEAAGRDVDEWRQDLTIRLLRAINVETVLPPLAPTEVGTSFSNDQERTEYTVPSLIDQEPIPYAVVTPSTDVIWNDIEDAFAEAQSPMSREVS